MIKPLFLDRHFYWQFVYFIELFFNYALFLIEFVDGHAVCGRHSRAKLRIEAGPGRGVLADHWFNAHAGLCREFESGS